MNHFFYATLLLAAQSVFAQPGQSQIGCIPEIQSSTNQLKCAIVQFPSSAYEGANPRTVAGSVVVKPTQGTSIKVPVRVGFDDQGILKAESLSRGNRILLDWSHFVTHGSDGGQIDGLVGLFDARISFTGKMMCGSTLSGLYKQACQ